MIMKSDKIDKKTSESQRARRFWRGHSRSDNAINVKEMSQDGGLQKKDAEGPCQI
jgi:hypothetical protein